MFFVLIPKWCEKK